MSIAEVKTQLAIKNILFATDFSTPSEAALPYAVEIARRYGSKIHVTHAIEPEPSPGIPLEPFHSGDVKEREEAEAKMQRFASPEIFGEVKHDALVRRGYHWDVIKGAIDERKIDLVVVGTHGRTGLKMLLVGSIAEEIFRKSPCPVMTIGPHAKPLTGASPWLKTLLFATDFSEGSARALPYAIGMSEEYGARLIAVHVVRPVVGEGVDFTGPLVANAEKMLRGFVPESHFTNEPKYVVMVGSPAGGILQLAQQEHVNLLVMGLRAGSTAAAHAPWATAHQVVAHAVCPVLTVRW